MARQNETSQPTQPVPALVGSTNIQQRLSAPRFPLPLDQRIVGKYLFIFLLNPTFLNNA